MNKAQLRRALKAARAAIAPRDRHHAAHAARRFARPLLLRARRIGFYAPHGAEFDLGPLLDAAMDLRCACYLPIVPRRGQRVLRFARVRPDSRYTRNRFGIREPVDPRPLAANRLDLLFVPLVGVDDAGYRLGMGGGYYDATLAYRARRKAWKKPLLIGVGYVCQRVPALPHAPWDAPLDGLLSEAGLVRFGLVPG